MFLIGTELDLATLHGHSRTALAVSQVSIALPAVCGALLALAMYGPLAPEGVGRTPFVLFIAVSMSITAFPVLARILADRGLTGTPLASLAIACAAIDDVAAWCLLAVVVAIAGGGSPLDALTTAAPAASFLLAMFYVVRPLVALWVRRATQPRDGLVLALLFSGACLASLATDEIGVHSLFGAFVFGRSSPATRRPWPAPPPGSEPSPYRCCCPSSSSRQAAHQLRSAGRQGLGMAVGRRHPDRHGLRHMGRPHRPPHGPLLAGLPHHRRPHELPWPHRARRTHHRPRPRRDQLRGLHHAGPHGPHHHRGHLPRLHLLRHGAPTLTDLALRDRSTKQGTDKTPV